MSELYIGLLSGTSIDAIDAILVDLAGEHVDVIATHSDPVNEPLRQALKAICQPGENEIERLGVLDVQVGRCFAQTAKTLLATVGVQPSAVRAIGTHGQAIRHRPEGAFPFTLQIGDPNVIAVETGITTIADFRRRDVALGGQGAPLAPGFHAKVFPPVDRPHTILNLGGIANVTLLSTNPNEPIIGFDTGPGNTLLDAWCNQHFHQPYDRYGAIAAKGQIKRALLDVLLSDPYFRKPPPKSTGPEVFNLDWLKACCERVVDPLAPEDVQATLVELTTQSIFGALTHWGFAEGAIFVCGGGVHNHFLMQRLQTLGEAYTVDSTQALGVDPDWVEALLFAWLAKQTLSRQMGNVPTVTGASKTAVLGGVYFA